MVLNGQTSALKSRDKISYYGMISLWEYWAWLTWEVDKGIFEGFCLPFSGTKGPLKGPRGSAMVLSGQTSVSWEVEIKYSTMGWFHYFWALLIREMDKGIFNDLRNCFAIFSRQTSVPWAGTCGTFWVPARLTGIRLCFGWPEQPFATGFIPADRSLSSL